MKGDDVVELESLRSNPTTVIQLDFCTAGTILAFLQESVDAE